MRLADRADGRANNFDLIRFAAASAVVLSHSFPLAGRPGEPFAELTGWQTLGTLAVFAFFTVSGFLITKSWADDPRLAAFAGKRLLRLGPGLVAAVVLAAYVLGPAVTTLSRADYLAHPVTRDYLNTVTLFPVRSALPGVFEGNPVPAVNGSLWTLPGEVLMYGVVAAVGVAGGLRRRWVVPALILALLGYQTHLAARPEVAGRLPVYLTVPAFLDCYHYFMAGAGLYLYRDVVPLSRAGCLAATAAVAVTARSPQVHLAAKLAVPYLVICGGLFRVGSLDRFGRYGDLSYGIYIYSFPVQQLVVWRAGGVIGWGVLFATAYPITLAVAFVSWHGIERPALSLKRLFARRPPVVSAIPSPSPRLVRRAG